MSKKVSGIVSGEMKVETFLKKEFALTERQIRQAKFRENGILVNGERKRVTEQLRAGDQVEVLLEERQNQKILPSAGSLAILYEDEDLLVVNKPAGLVVHPSHGHYSDTLLNRAVYHCEERGEHTLLRAVGRLDKDTSGVLVLAKNQVAAARLSADKEAGMFEKEYLALTGNRPKQAKGTIDLPIGKDPQSLSKMRIDPDGLHAVTHYELAENKNRKMPPYLIKLQIETGRTHQIRVHMAALGCPLLGDPLYGGGKSDKITRTALHAWRCSLTHPFCGDQMHFYAELPEDMKRMLGNADSSIHLKKHL